MRLAILRMKGLAICNCFVILSLRHLSHILSMLPLTPLFYCWVWIPSLRCSFSSSYMALFFASTATSIAISRNEFSTLSSTAPKSSFDIFVFGLAQQVERVGENLAMTITMFFRVSNWCYEPMVNKVENKVWQICSPKSCDMHVTLFEFALKSSMVCMWFYLMKNWMKCATH